MLVFKIDSESERLLLQDAKRSRWDLIRDQVDKEIAERIESGAPMKDEATGYEITPLPPYKPDPGYDDGPVTVVLRVVSGEVKGAAEIAVGAFSAAAADDVAARLNKDRGFRLAMRDFVARGVKDVGGLEFAPGQAFKVALDKDGAIDSASLDVLEVSRLMLPLYQVAMEFNTLSGADRGNFGGSPPSGSATLITIAQDAQRRHANGKDATAALISRDS